MGITPIYSIPFADPTDLVRDWPALSEDVAEAVEAAVAGVPVLAGMGSNVVQTVKTNTFSTTSSAFTDVTGLEVTITPTSNTSKVLVISQSWLNGSTSAINSMRLMRGSTSIYRDPTSRGNLGQLEGQTANHAQPYVFLDSPNTTDPVTYKIQVATSGGAVRVNATAAGDFPAASSITAIEVAA